MPRTLRKKKRGVKSVKKTWQRVPFLKPSQFEILKQIVNLSYPVVISLVLQTAFNIIDTAFVGHISSKALAAVAIVFPVSYVLITFISGLNIATTNLIGRYLGAGDKKKAANIAEHAFLIALIISAVITPLSLIFAEELFILLGAKTFLTETLAYFKWIAISFFFLNLIITAEYVIRGEKDVWTPFRYLFYALLVNTALDAIFILELNMGVSGAGLATLIARGFESFMLLSYIWQKKTKMNINLRNFDFSFDIIKSILKMGIPSALAQVNVALGLIFINRIAAIFGHEAVAAYGLGFRLDSIAFMPTLGIAAATLIIISHHVGAREFKKARQAALLANFVSALFMEIMGIIFFLFPEFWIGLFTNDAKVLALGVAYIKIVCLSYIFIAIGIITGASYYGYGRTMPAVIISLSRLWLIAIPLAYFLGTTAGLEAIGIWMAILISNIVSGVMGAIWLYIMPEKEREKNLGIYEYIRRKVIKRGKK